MSSAADEGVSFDDSQHELETVFVGPPSEVYIVQALLEDLGFFTHIANANIKTLDPFVTGMSPLDMRLQVPRSDAERAFRALREARGERHGDARLVESTGGYDPALLASLDDLSRRIRWAAVCLVLAPVAALLGLLYIARTFPLEEKPAQHTFTMAAIVASWTVWILAITFWIAVSGIGR